MQSSHPFCASFFYQYFFDLWIGVVHINVTRYMSFYLYFSPLLFICLRFFFVLCHCMSVVQVFSQDFKCLLSLSVTLLFAFIRYPLPPSNPTVLNFLVYFRPNCRQKTKTQQWFCSKQQQLLSSCRRAIHKSTHVGVWYLKNEFSTCSACYKTNGTQNGWQQ